MRLLLVTSVCLAALLVLTVGADGFPNPSSDAGLQWYLGADHAWDAWPTRPTLAPIKVAVLDTGIDAGDPSFAGRIAAGKSFVGGPWGTDVVGHGTFVAGLIASNPVAGSGVSGLAVNAKLLIAKIVPGDNGRVSADVEAKAIYWAVAQGARVINLSIGGLRDPEDSSYDSYNPVEERAVEYAYGHGVLVVAAAGNGTNAPALPWPYADYPAALPHVLGVAALTRSGGVPEFSNRDPVFVDIAAPGAGIFSTIPRSLIQSTAAACQGRPYSNCGPTDYRNAIGTSFAAPQVSAAAALLLGVDPQLTPGQLEWILERSAVDATPANGCTGCTTGRDRLTGWGHLDVAAAVALMTSHGYPPADSDEPNDTIETAWPLGTLPATVTASVDLWDDPIDLYAVTLTAGERISLRLTQPNRERLGLTLWRPGTTTVTSATPSAGVLATTSTGPAAAGALHYRATEPGTYYVEVSTATPSRDPARYRLALARG